METGSPRHTVPYGVRSLPNVLSETKVLTNRSRSATRSLLTDSGRGGIQKGAVYVFERVCVSEDQGFLTRSLQVSRDTSVSRGS